MLPTHTHTHTHTSGRPLNPHGTYGDLAPASQVVGHWGEALTLGQPVVPSDGYGSDPTGPWWWQWGREKAEQRP